jgi:hypothetical protein
MNSSFDRMVHVVDDRTIGKIAHSLLWVGLPALAAGLGFYAVDDRGLCRRDGLGSGLCFSLGEVLRVCGKLRCIG